MKKHTFLFVATLIFSLVLTANLFAQEETKEEPKQAAETEKAEKPERIIPDITITPLETLSISKLQKAVKAGALARGWATKVQSEKTIRCNLSVRKHRVVVDVILDPEEITFRYVTSENLNYDPTNAKKKIHRKYEAWVNLLGKEINKEISKIATEEALK